MYRSESGCTDWLSVVYEDPVFRSTVTNPVIEQLDGTTCRVVSEAVTSTSPIAALGRKSIAKTVSCCKVEMVSERLS